MDKYWNISSIQILILLILLNLDDAGHNKQHGVVSNAVKLDQETEELKHEKLDLQVGKIIQQARNAKNMTQVELARVS